MTEGVEVVPGSDRDALADEVWEGLRRDVPELSPRLFYDERGSELFEQITGLDEYYPTRTETALLERWSGPIVERLRPAALLELGAGSARKTRLLLSHLAREVPGARYVPLDVSADFLERTAATLRSEYPALEVVPEVADFNSEIVLSHPLPRPALFAFLGGTIGNFAATAGTDLLRRLAARMNPGDHLLLGADLRPGPGKTREELVAAYDDARGVTAAFNLNILAVLDAAIGTDFDLDDWRHRAVWVEDEGRIEMHLVAVRDVDVAVPERGLVRFAKGDAIRTEISSKYDRATLESMFDRAGLRVTDWLTDARDRYALVIGRPS